MGKVSQMLLAKLKGECSVQNCRYHIIYKAELNVYNQMVESNTDNAKVAVEWLMSRREASGAVEPNLLSGKAGSPQRDEFRSTAEVVQAMKDPRYNDDPAFRKDVEEKLARSSVF